MQGQITKYRDDLGYGIIEADNGRYAPGRKGLPLDIDVLLYGDRVGNFDGLVLPRPEVLKNAFVLWPLALLAPEALQAYLNYQAALQAERRESQEQIAAELLSQALGAGRK